VWTYNGQLPGPYIHAKLGDRLIVHFKNSLPEATTIHWHGLRVPNAMDGTPGLSQKAVAPDKTFTYDLVLKDAGTYCYHPHVNSAAQVGWGLYGPIVVEDPADPKTLGDSLVLMLSDMSLDDAGQLLPKDNGGAFGDLFGHEGNVLLVNGRVMPTLKVRAGKPQRWRIINAARSRYRSFALRGDPFTRIGGDNGLAARSERASRVVIAPAERLDLVYTPNLAPGGGHDPALVTLRSRLWHDDQPPRRGRDEDRGGERARGGARTDPGGAARDSADRREPRDPAAHRAHDQGRRQDRRDGHQRRAGG
jgi:FtsP/CotA-like multicopper oxidase with cupredoxin domain